jgi:hypothetical protein
MTRPADRATRSALVNQHGCTRRPPVRREDTLADRLARADAIDAYFAAGDADA